MERQWKGSGKAVERPWKGRGKAVERQLNLPCRSFIAASFAAEPRASSMSAACRQHGQLDSDTKRCLNIVHSTYMSSL